MNHDRTYWRSQPDKRLIEAVLQDGQTDPEICIAMAERLDNIGDMVPLADVQRDQDLRDRHIETLENELADALTTIEAQQGEIYKWEQANGYD